MNEYPCVARNVNAFVRQVVRYVNSEHYFYVRCLMKDRRNQITPEEVDKRVITTYDIARKRWQRKRRHLKERAGIHYIRFGRLYVLMLTKGKHDAFYRDHGSSKLDIRRKALNVFSYSIKRSYSEYEKREKVFVRLTNQERTRLTQHMHTICTWDSFRVPNRLEREFSGLPYDGYGPVQKQLGALVAKVNRARRKRGFEAIDSSCVNKFVNLQAVYQDNGLFEKRTRKVGRSDRTAYDNICYSGAESLVAPSASSLA